MVICLVEQVASNNAFNDRDNYWYWFCVWAVNLIAVYVVAEYFWAVSLFAFFVQADLKWAFNLNVFIIIAG